MTENLRITFRIEATDEAALELELLIIDILGYLPRMSEHGLKCDRKNILEDPRRKPAITIFGLTQINANTLYEILAPHEGGELIEKIRRIKAGPHRRGRSYPEPIEERPPENMEEFLDEIMYILSNEREGLLAEICEDLDEWSELSEIERIIVRDHYRKELEASIRNKALGMLQE